MIFDKFSKPKQAKQRVQFVSKLSDEDSNYLKDILEKQSGKKFKNKAEIQEHYEQILREDSKAGQSLRKIMDEDKLSNTDGNLQNFENKVTEMRNQYYQLQQRKLNSGQEQPSIQRLNKLIEAKVSVQDFFSLIVVQDEAEFDVKLQEVTRNNLTSPKSADSCKLYKAYFEEAVNAYDREKQLSQLDAVSTGRAGSGR